MRSGCSNGRPPGSTVYQLVDNSENIYILNLTVSNASRICMLSDENLVCKAVQYSVLKGRKVIVGGLCCGIDCARVNNAYLDKIKNFESQWAAMV